MGSIDKTEILLFSSGMDSMVAWYYLNKPPCLHVTGHSKYSIPELINVIRFGARHPEMKFKVVDKQDWLTEFEEPDANIAARNLLFVDIAAHYGDCIYLVCQLGEQEIPDRNKKFFDDISNLLTYLYGKVKTVSPVFSSWTKQDMVSWYLGAGYSKEELWASYSCFSSDNDRCGRCAACFRTAVALDYNNILPDDFFNEDIWCWDGIPGYINRIKAHELHERRASQTQMVLEKRGF